MNLYTSYYAISNNFPSEYKLVSVSGDGGKMANFDGVVYRKLAPKFDFWKKWHDNIGKVNVEENTKFYISNYYNKVLSALNPHEIAEELGENVVLLCYEKSSDFCHRHIIAEWFKLYGIETKELNFCNGEIRETNRPLNISKILHQVIEKASAESK